MTHQELNDVMESINKLDISNMEAQDFALYLISLTKFAEAVKPLVIKYADRLPENAKFMLKL